MDARQLYTVTAITRRHILELYPPNSCIASTRILIEVLRYFGCRAEPLPVKVLACNAAAAPLLEAGTPIAQWPESAYSIGVDATGTRADKGWDGHLVVTANRHLIDPSADQLDRPDHDLRVPGPIVLPIQDWPVRAQRHNTTIVYWPADSLGNWATAPDWSLNRPEARSAVGASIREAKHHLFTAEIRPRRSAQPDSKGCVPA